MRVFKYVSQYGPEILRTQKIYASSAHDLNDPFELSPSIDLSQFTKARIMQMMRHDRHINDSYAKEGRQLGFTNKKRYKSHYLSTLEARAAGVLKKVPANVEGIRRDFARRFSERFRLFCVSRRCDSILMWSHYASNHSGAVIEFDLSFLPFRNLSSDFVINVNYSEKKPEFKYSPKKAGDFMGALLNVVATKSVDWAYEDEVRLVFPRKFCKEGHFISVDKDAIRRVCIGCRASKEYKAEIIDALSSPSLNHVRLSQAFLSKEGYNLEFRDLK